MVPWPPLNDGEMNDPAFADLIKNHTELRVELRRRTSFDVKALRMSVRIGDLLSTSNATPPKAGNGKAGMARRNKGRNSQWARCMWLCDSIRLDLEL